MLYNPYFTQMLNPAYLDVLDCPYLNYAKNPEESIIESKKQCSTLPEQNVSDFIDALKYDWEALSNETRDEYNSKLAELIQNKHIVENFEESSPINTAYPNEFTIYIVYILTILGFVVYFLNSTKNFGHVYLSIYLILLIIGTSIYYFSHR